MDETEEESPAKRIKSDTAAGTEHRASAVTGKSTETPSTEPTTAKSTAADRGSPAAHPSESTPTSDVSPSQLATGRVASGLETAPKPVRPPLGAEDGAPSQLQTASTSAADTPSSTEVTASDKLASLYQAVSKTATDKTSSMEATASHQTSTGDGASPSEARLASRLETVSKSALLAYETPMLLDLLHADGLLVTAKGLGVERLLAALLRVLCDPGQLVLVLGTSAADQQLVTDQLEADGVSPLPRAVTADTGVAERQRVYLSGGVLFVTSRILVVDLLTDRCPADLVTGVVVHRAHTIVESAQEAFILRLFRQKNKTGFIKALSSSPLSFTSGFCHVERVMRNLFVRHLYLWPRFQAHVNETLKQCTPEVVELRVQMTSLMTSIQTALLDLVNVTLKEIKRLNPSLDWETMTTELVLSRSFHKLSRLRLDPVWHQLSGRTRQLVAELRTLRALLAALPQHDCCTYYSLVAEEQRPEKAMNSGWALLEPAETLFVDARRRVFGDTPPVRKQRGTPADQPQVLRPEESPKWRALSEVLREIGAEVAPADGAAAASGQECSVLIVAADMAACRRIKEFLTWGAQTTLWRRFQQTLAPRYPEDAYIPAKVTEDAATPANDATEEAKEGAQTKAQAEKKEKPDAEADDLQVLLPASPLIILQPVKDPADPFQLQRTLQRCRPRYVVLYDMDVAVVRTIEVHQAATPECRLRVYTLMFGGTTEEQTYLTALRAEKQAFEYLIKQKATMVIPEEREGRDDTNADLERGVPAAEEAARSSRQGGVAPASAEHPRVIVDMREFRSELPALLHRRGVDIVPATIEVGDYIVTPDMCVERKSVSDLIGSLLSGRLYSQALAMHRHYRRPVLLIEFDQDKPFTLQGRYYLSSDVSSQQVVSRLQLLTLHFPRLRLMWCPSPYASAELLHQLKAGAAEPSLAEARAATADRTDTIEHDRYSPQIRDLVSKLPGVRASTLYALLNKIDTLADLFRLSKEQLAGVLQSESDAAQLHEALHEDLATAAAGSTGAGSDGRRAATAATAGAGAKSTGRGRPRFWRSKQKR